MISGVSADLALWRVRKTPLLISTDLLQFSSLPESL
jgi:hypothetical protein